MRLLIALLLLAPVAAFAQQAPGPAPGPNPNEAFMQQAIGALRTQREAAQDDAATARAQLAQAQAQNAELQKQLGAAKAESEKMKSVPKPVKPVEPPKDKK